MTDQFFATCPKAIENLLADELGNLSAKEIKPTMAGVHFTADIRTAYRICLWSRLANRILLHLTTFPVTSQDDLYNGIQQIDWSRHLNQEGSLAVTFNVKQSTAINNSHFGALKSKDAIVDQMRAKFQVRPNINTEHPDLRINVNLQGEIATVSLDLSGDSLHRRGYRDITIKAPIKENLAAALLIRSGWPDIARQGGSLVDPMCGSGTLLIEAAMIAADYAPGLLRNYFGFLNWQQHQPVIWQELLNEATARKQAGLVNMPRIIGFDLDRRHLKAARQHYVTCGLENYIDLDCKDISSAQPNPDWQPGLVMCNPPYGERLGDAAETALLYRRFGDTLKMHYRNWQAATIINDAELGFRLGLRSKKPITFYNGAMECKLLRFTIEDDAFFEPKPKTTQDRIAYVNQLAGNPYQQYLAKKQSFNQQLIDSSHDNSGNQIDTGATDLANRLCKNLKQLAHWKTKNQIYCYRLYDADLPEFATAIDVYQGEDTWAVVQEYEPPKTIDPIMANQRLAMILNETALVLGIAKANVYLKIRRRQRQLEQYDKLGNQGQFHIVEEHGCRLRVNFNDYLDTGLFLDHRPLRLMIQQLSTGKRFLNLFAYTGSATVHAALGGAKSTTTVDMSATYLDWAKANLALNQCTGQHEFIQADCVSWLAKEAAHPYPREYDLIFLDPPTFSNSKRMQDIFDIQKDYIQLIQNAVRLLAKNGLLFFSTNFRQFKFDSSAFTSYKIEDISKQTIPPDFTRNPKIHYCWRISR